MPKNHEQYVLLSKKVRSVLAPFYKQNDLFFGTNGIYNKLSEKQIENCYKNLLETVSNLYSEVKKGKL